MDHLLNNGYIRERLDDRPYYHPLATLSYLAATTRRVSLGTSVMVLPYHNPWSWRSTPRPSSRCRAGA
jgi:alkanesulfonate monooxygenase SsuD/methylene tetrahydromethanopterin reductase-like flavin-dependent oxidoreductase (luciferase family)